VHYRQVPEANIAEFELRIEEVWKQQTQLRFTTGKKVFEFLPAIEWNKGKPCFRFMRLSTLIRSKIVPLFIGDDITDEDAFQAIDNIGISIVVGEENRQTRARYSLKNPQEVIAFLEDLAAFSEKDG